MAIGNEHCRGYIKVICLSSFFSKIFQERILLDNCYLILVLELDAYLRSLGLPVGKKLRSVCRILSYKYIL